MMGNSSPSPRRLGHTVEQAAIPTARLRKLLPFHLYNGHRAERLGRSKGDTGDGHPEWHLRRVEDGSHLGTWCPTKDR